MNPLCICRFEVERREEAIFANRSLVSHVANTANTSNTGIRHISNIQPIGAPSFL